MLQRICLEKSNEIVTETNSRREKKKYMVNCHLKKKSPNSLKIPLEFKLQFDLVMDRFYVIYLNGR